MAIFDTFCAITGWRYMWSDVEFIEAISGEDQLECLWGPLQLDSDDPDDREYVDDTTNLSFPSVVPSRAVQRGLKYTSGDVVAMSKYVLVTPSERSEDGELVPKKLWGIRPVEDLDKEDVAYLFNVYPSTQGPEMGIYFQRKGRKDIELTGVGRSFGSYLITFCSFLIMQHLIPGLEARSFCKLALEAKGYFKVFPQGVDYGPVSRTIMQDVMWCRIADIDDDEPDAEEENYVSHEQRWWLKLLTQEGKTDEEILEDAWMGRGNMWAFKHPGIFPIEETVKLKESLPSPMYPPISGHVQGATCKLPVFPVELIETILSYLPPEDTLHFISSTSRLYYQYRGGLDKYAYAWIQQERPWYFPAGPIDCEDGDEEIVCWQRGWKELMGVDVQRSQRKDLPWFAYHFACKRSPNMRSRERIWGIVLQIKVLLKKENLYS